MKFRKKPVVIEATQWWKNGDHPQDYIHAMHGIGPDGNEKVFSADERRQGNWEGDIVQYYRAPNDDGRRTCEKCLNIIHDHGWIDTLEGGHTVCPGDWIITGVKGERYPCKPDIFDLTYEAVAD